MAAVASQANTSLPPHNNHSNNTTTTTTTTTTAPAHSIVQQLPHGLGLLTTVASLPPKYRSRYLSIKTKCEIPLDLSVKPPSPQIANDVPMATAFAEVYTEPANNPPTPATIASRSPSPAPSPAPVAAAAAASVAELTTRKEVVLVITEKPITPPQSPAKRKFNELQTEQQTAANNVQPAKIPKTAKTKPMATATATAPVAAATATPARPIRATESAPRTAKAAMPSCKPARNKATRKLKFDEETSSPVSGTIIRPLEDITDGTMQYSNGDIDPKYNIVEITEETKAELAAIKNVIGDYVCKLCRIKFDDAFGLARHRCACIVLLEYRCPECGKQFNCPANLASHRRWHKPKKVAAAASTATAKKENRNTTNQQLPVADSKESNELPFDCAECGKRFKRQAYLRKHQQTHAKREAQQAGKGNISSTTSTTTTTTTAAATSITGSFQTAPYKSTSSSSSSSSQHSYAATQEDEGVYVAGAAASSTSHYDDYDADDYMSDCSSSTSSAGYGRLQIVEHGLTEEESIAAAALTNLRNCASVIQHTTLAH